MDTAQEVSENLNSFLADYGFECHPFKIGWYNECVKQGFHLDYPHDTLAFVTISRPSFFENCVIPFACQNINSGKEQDLVDHAITECLKSAVEKIRINLPSVSANVDILHDYEMRPGTRRPKVLVQTAGHVSGAVYLYRREDIVNPPWPAEQTIHGVCLHPKYVGWFALRAVLVFKDMLAPQLVQIQPKDIIQDNEMKIELLNRYNQHWEDWSFRDILQPIERYSELQKEYFRTKPAERKGIIDLIKSQSVT